MVAGLLLLAASFVVIAGTTMAGGYGRVFTAILLMGFGMGFAMGPATEAVMGSLPPERAGVGSAINDTVRQVGGALGVAVLGSVLNSVYRDRLADDVRGLPAEAAEAARDNVQGALAVAADLPDPAAQALSETAARGFIDAMNVSVLVAAAVVLSGAVLAAVMLPHHAEPGRPALPAEGGDGADSGLDEHDEAEELEAAR